MLCNQVMYHVFIMIRQREDVGLVTRMSFAKHIVVEQ